MKRAPTSDATCTTTTDCKAARWDYEDTPARHLQLVEEQTASDPLATPPSNLLGRMPNAPTKRVVNETTKEAYDIRPRDKWWLKKSDGSWVRTLARFGQQNQDFAASVVVYAVVSCEKMFTKGTKAMVYTKQMDRSKGLRCDNKSVFWADEFHKKTTKQITADVPFLRKFTVEDTCSPLERAKQILRRQKEDKKVELFEQRMRAGGHAILREKYIKKTKPGLFQHEIDAKVEKYEKNITFYSEESRLAYATLGRSEYIKSIEDNPTADETYSPHSNPCWLEGKFYMNAVLTTRSIAQMFDLSRPPHDMMNEALLVLDAHHYDLELQEMKRQDTIKFKAAHDKYVDSLDEFPIRTIKTRGFWFFLGGVRWDRRLFKANKPH